MTDCSIHYGIRPEKSREVLEVERQKSTVCSWMQVDLRCHESSFTHSPFAFSLTHLHMEML